MQNFQANNFPTLRSATQPKKEREKGRKKLIKKICAHAKTRTRTHTQLICARVYVCVWQIVLADLQLLVHIPLCVFLFYFDIIARTQMSALVGLPRGACLFAC